MDEKCLIIGGNSGIGNAVADDIYAYDPDIQLVRPIKDIVDVTFRTEMFACLRKEGPFRFIVYSAGINKLCWIKDMESYVARSVYDDTFDVNVFGFIHLVHSHVFLYPDAKVSAVAVSSDAATIPMRGSLAYCASKAALDMAIRCMARELAPLWRVNGVAPGMVEGTAMTEYIDRTIPEFRGWTPEYAREYERVSVPTGRRATLEEVAETIRWVLFGPEQMTGEIVRINGGKS